MTTKKNKVESPVKENKKSPEKHRESAKDVIIRVWRVIVASSIAYAIVVIAMGTDGLLPKLILIPALIHAGWLLIKR